MKLIDRLAGAPSPDDASRYSLSDWLRDSSYAVGGNQYLIHQTFQPGENKERIRDDFAGYAETIYRRNAIVYSCMAFRSSVFSEARFQFQSLSKGRPGDLFATPDLAVLETPWPNGTTGELLARMIQDVDLAGNAFVSIDGGTLYRHRPDWVQIVMEAAGPSAHRAVGYLYFPDGKGMDHPKNGVRLSLASVAHWSPKPDPLARFRGMAPLTPVLREIMADGQMTEHKSSFLINGATPNLVIKTDPATSFENFVKFKEEFRDDHEGAANAYKTLFLGGGADATVVGANLKEIDFKNTQGAGETRIAAAFEVPPVLVGLSEGLQAATYSNYASARRRAADGTFRPLWRSVAAALASIIQVPGGARLWYDDRDVAFLREDAQDAATIKQTEAATIRTLVDAGYDPKSVGPAVASGDFSKLVHTGLFSVQLQPPATVSTGWHAGTTQAVENPKPVTSAPSTTT